MRAPPRHGKSRFGPLLAKMLVASLGLAAGGTKSPPKATVDPGFGYQPMPRTKNTAREQARRVRQRKGER